MCNWYSQNISIKIPLFELPIIHDELVFRNKLKNSLIISKENSINFNLEKHKIILYVGRLDPEKNIEFLIRVFSKMNPKNTKLAIVGNGKLDAYLKSLSKSLKMDEKIIFTGRLDGFELISWFNLSNVFVLPSTYEPYGAVVNEALISGSTVLCSKFAGASALMTTYNGLIFDPKNEIEFIKKLNILLNKSSNINSKNLSLRRSLMPFTFKSKLNVIANKL
jgi:glycosyltransferase involved in cell wall biosynthesis